MLFVLHLLQVPTAWAGAYTMQPDGAPPTVAVDDQVGLVAQLPGPVRVVTPTTRLQVAPLGSSAGARHFTVTVAPGATIPEQVTFVLADGRSLSATFSPASGVLDTFADLVLPAPPVVTDDDFLAEERALLQAMLQDDPARRQLHDEQVEYEAVPELSWTLRRTHHAQGLVGYTFVVRNDGRKRLGLDLSVLAVDRPNRLVLAQADFPELASCTSSDADPCETALRLVVRTQTDRTHLGGGASPATGRAPYVWSSAEVSR